MDSETRSPLQSRNPNVMVSKLRPPSAIKRPLQKDTTDEPKMKVPKCDLSVNSKQTSKSQIQGNLRRQTSAAVMRRNTSKPDMPPPASAPRTTTMRRQTSSTQIRKGATASAAASRVSGARTTASSKVNSEPKAKPTTGGKKRAAWDYKGRLEDMEKKITNNQDFMDSMNKSLHSNKDRIEFLESTNKELEQANEDKSQKNQQHSVKINDLKIENQSLIDEISSQKQKHEFEVEVRGNKIKSLEKELTNVEGELRVAKDEGMALKSTIAQMTAQSYGIRTELEAIKLSLQSSLTAGQQKDDLNSQLKKRITELEQLVSDKDSKLRDEETLRRKLRNTIQELKGNIRVFCRIRPPLESERSSSQVNFTFNKDERGVTLEQSVPSEDVSGSKRNPSRFDFTFDKIFNQTSNQSHIFQEISQLAQSALDGYNVCIFAYGQTGSGKTFTMEGDHSEYEKRGMIPRSMEHVFKTSCELKERGWEYKMEASFLEIYNEVIRDLLGSDNVKHDIKIVKNTEQVTVTNLKAVEVKNEDQVSSLLKTAAQNRAVAATKCNERSSRSHSVFILKLSGKNTLTDEKCQGTLNLVDLAGSERLSQSCSTGERLKETKNINSSLSTLSSVIMALANKESFIPYRNSKLTYLLKNSLGGNSKSLMFVNISPREESLQETLCSLRFATKVNQCNIGTAQKKVLK